MYTWAFPWLLFMPQMSSVGPQQSYTKEQQWLSVPGADPTSNTVWIMTAGRLWLPTVFC